MYRFGRHGSLRLGGQRVAKVRDWSLENSLELLETTTAADTAPTYRPGASSNSGSCTLLYYRLEAKELGKQRQFTQLLSKVHRTGPATTQDRMELELRISDRPGDTIRCNVWITSAGLSTASGELVVIPVRFTVHGHLLEAIS